MKRAPIVFPIRFATGNLAVQTTTRELSDRGVLVRCLTAPPAGTAFASTGASSTSVWSAST